MRTTPFFNKRLGRFGNKSYLCTTRTRQASPRCSNVRVVLYFVDHDRWYSSCLLLSNSFWTSYRTLIGHLSGHFSNNMSICPFICPFMLADFQRVRTILLACLLIYPPFYLPFNVPIYFSLLFEFFSPALCCGVSSSRLQVYHDKATKFNCERSVFAIG